LAVGGTYPTITVTVDVAANAASSVTNSATASGGGSSSTTANDPTTINPLNQSSPDLTITKTHTGTFKEAQVGADYTLVVGNAGSAPTSGLVSVIDLLPSGMTATAMTGTGWTCTLATLTCQRSDSLATGGSYPAITLTVDVATTMPSSVTNTATVSGGGDSTPGNNTANDVTAIRSTGKP